MRKSAVVIMLLMLAVVLTLAISLPSAAQVNGVRPTILTINPAQGKTGKTVTLSCLLTDMNMRGLGGLTVDVYALRPSTGSTTRIGTRISTGNVGRASFDLDLRSFPADDYLITWNFPGNGAYGAALPVSSLKVTK